MRATRKDANHTAIVKLLRDLFFDVVDVSHFLGLGYDLVAKRHGKIYMVEVKDGAKPPSARKLTKSEAAAKEFYGHKWVLIESADDVHALAKRC